MKTPICSICLQSDIFCASCRKNIETGNISDHGVKAIKKLYDLSKSIKSLGNATIKKILDFDEIIVVVCDKSDVPNLVGRDGRIVNDLRKSLGKQVKIIGDGDTKSMVSDLMFPAKVASIGSFYSSGLESLKVNMDKNQLRNLPANREELINAAKKLSGMNVILNIR